MLLDMLQVVTTCHKRFTAILLTACTRVKISRLVTSLQTNCQQVEFTLSVPSCRQEWDNFLTSCNELVESKNLLQGCSNKSGTNMI